METTPTTRGRVIHAAAGYDLLAWTLLLGREGAFRRRLVSLARLAPGESVLDVGCGTGSLAIAAKRHVATGEVHGIDPSPEMIARARKKADRARVEVTFATAVAESLPFADERFDAVLSTLMLHHLPPVERRQCALEMRRVLKPGGRALVVDFGIAPRARRKGILGHLHRHGSIDMHDLADTMNEARLESVDMGPVGYLDVDYVLLPRM